MAGGIFALEEYLSRHGHPTEIINLWIEHELDSSFSIKKYAAEGKFGLIGISMHWCEQISAAISVAEDLKDLDCPLVFGGYGATYFGWEILRRFDFVDFIIRGDGEIPLLSLCNELEGASPKLSNVPNLLYKVKGQPIESECFYSADTKQLDNLIYHNVERLRHYLHYIKKSRHPSEGNLFKEPCFFLLPGRGCNFNCTFCGGNREVQKCLHYRRKVVCRSPEKILETIVSAYERGFRHFHTCFDPQPNGPFYSQIFSLIRERDLKIGFIFESFGLPEKSFLEEFAATFFPGMIIISPESASERVRNLNKTLSFTNRELEETLVIIEKLGLSCQLFYSYFLPNDRKEDIRQTLLAIGSMRIRYRHFLETFYLPFDNDPCAPYRLNPESFGMTRTNDSLDYYLAVRPERIHNIPHPEGMSDEDAMRLSQLIDFFTVMVNEFTNTFKYINQKINSLEHFLILVEKWIYSHPGSYGDFNNFFGQMSEQLKLEKDKCDLLIDLDKLKRIKLRST